MSKLYVQEEFVNATEHYSTGSDDPQEAFTDNLGELYRFCRREYGRCTGRIYIGGGVPVGWVFLKRCKYEDTGEVYLREAWITVHTAPPTRTVKYHYQGGA